MFKELRSNSLLALVIVVMMACLFWLNTFFATLHPYKAIQSGLLSDFYQWINQYGVVRYLLGVTLTILPALVLNRSFNRNDFIDKNVYLTGFFFVLGMGLMPSQFYISPVLIGNVFLVFSVILVLRFRRNKDHKRDLFNSVLLISFGSFFYPSMILLALYPFISLVLIKSISLKEFFLAILAVLVPYFSFSLITLGAGEVDVFIEHFQSQLNLLFADSEPTSVATMNWIYYILLFLQFGIMLFSMSSNYGSQGLQTRRLLSGVITLTVMELLVLVLEYFDLVSATLVLDFVVVSAFLATIYYFPIKVPLRKWIMYLGFFIIALIYGMHYSHEFAQLLSSNLEVFSFFSN